MDTETRYNLNGYNILVVDDSASARKFFSGCIEEGGGRVLTAENGRDALKKCENNQVDLLITDINMPIMNGFELVGHIKTSAGEIPHVMITDADIDEYLDLAIDKDVGNILSKKTSPNELRKVCYKILTGNGIFGLDNYIKSNSPVKQLFICNSDEIQPAIQEIRSKASDTGIK